MSQFIPKDITEILFDERRDCVTLFEGDKPVERYEGKERDLVLRWVQAPDIRDGWVSANLEIWRKVD